MYVKPDRARTKNSISLGALSTIGLVSSFIGGTKRVLDQKGTIITLHLCAVIPDPTVWLSEPHKADRELPGVVVRVGRFRGSLSGLLHLRYFALDVGAISRKFPRVCIVLILFRNFFLILVLALLVSSCVYYMKENALEAGVCLEFVAVHSLALKNS